jgi:hypothetical protein
MIDPKLFPQDRISPGKSKVGLPRSWSRADLCALLNSSDDDAIRTILTYAKHEEKAREQKRKYALSCFSDLEKAVRRAGERRR